MKLLRSLATSTLILAGCAIGVSSERISAAESSIRAAEEVGAPGVPAAALHLQLAKEETRHAMKLIGDGDDANAEGQLLRAQADAELAVALTREAGLKADAEKVVDQARSLKEQDR